MHNANVEAFQEIQEEEENKTKNKFPVSLTYITYYVQPIRVTCSYSLPLRDLPVHVAKIIETLPLPPFVHDKLAYRTTVYPSSNI